MLGHSRYPVGWPAYVSLVTALGGQLYLHSSGWHCENSQPSTMQLNRPQTGCHTCLKPCALGPHALRWCRPKVSSHMIFRHHRQDRQERRHASHHISTCRAQQDGSAESTTNLVSTVGLLGLWIALAGEPAKPPVLLPCFYLRAHAVMQRSRLCCRRIKPPTGEAQCCCGRLLAAVGLCSVQIYSCTCSAGRAALHTAARHQAAYECSQGLLSAACMACKLYFHPISQLLCCLGTSTSYKSWWALERMMESRSTQW